MALTLITGPANAGKAGRILAGYRSVLAREPLLVVPRFEDVAHYQRELAAGGAVFAGRVMRFAWLWQEVARRTGSTLPRVGQLERERVMRVAAAGAGLRALEASARAPGFAAAALRFVAELDAALVEPQELSGALEAWAGPAGGERRSLARDLSAIHQSYRELLLELGGADEEGFARAALDALRADPAAWGATPVFLYGFDDLTGLELAAVEALAMRCGAQVTVSLTWEDGREAFSSRSRTVAALRALAGPDDEVRLPARPEHYADSSRHALHHLERGLFGAGRARQSAEGAVAVVEAGGERSEAELLAAEALDLLRAGVIPGEIAIVYRVPQAAASVVEPVFSAYGVPLAVDRPAPLAHTSVGAAVLHLLRCASDGGSAADLVGYLRAAGRPGDEPVLDRFESQIRRAGLRTVAAARGLWERSQPGVRELDDLRNAGDDGLAAVCAATAALCERLFVAPGRRQAAPVDLREAAAYRAVLDALEQLAHTAQLDSTRGQGVYDLLEALAGLEVPMVPHGAEDMVVLTDPLAVRARRFDAVLVAGLHEGELPRAARPDPFLPDDVRRILARSTPGLRRPEDRLDDERFLFYALASRPRRRLVLAHRTCDEEGRPLIASPFLAEVRELFDDGLPAQRRRPLGEVTWPVADAPTPAERERSLRAAGPVQTPRPIAPVAAPDALAALRGRPPVSPGALEAYASCPVKWLVERVLRARGIDPDAQPLARGSFAHAVLERTLAGVREEHGSARITPATLPAAERLLDGEVARICEDEQFVLAPSRAESRAVARRVQVQVRRLLRHEAGAQSPFEPRHLELTFGFEGEEDAGEAPSLAPLVLGGGRIQVRGRIDRVDVDPDTGRAIVRDYKAGEAKSEHAEKRWRESGQLQVALYMLAVQRLLGHEVVGGVYQSLQGTDLRARGLLLDAPDVRGLTETALRQLDVREPEAFAAALDAAEEAALELGAGMRAGRLAPCPDTCGYSGGGCAYPGICRSEDA